MDAAHEADVERAASILTLRWRSEMERTIAERNKQLALKAFDTLFNRHDYDAAATMWSEGYIQHSTSYRPRSPRALRARAVLSRDVSVRKRARSR